MLNKIVGSMVLLSLVGLFSGCSSKYSTKVIPLSYKENAAYISADQDATNWSVTGRGDTLRTNYKYSFAIAAKTTIDKGYKYFSIFSPFPLVQLYQAKNVANVQEAYDACDKGEGSFRVWAASHSYDDSDSLRKRNANSMKPNAKFTNHCDKISYRFRSGLLSSGAEHSLIAYKIQYHNEDRKDNITFNAQEILDSQLVSDLNPAYFVPMTR